MSDEQIPFTIDDERKAAWAVDKVLVVRERLARVKLACAEAIREAEAEVRDADAFFLPQLEAWAKDNLPKGKKSIRLTTGAMGFRTVPGGPRVVDESRALVWARTELPSAVRVVESVNKTAVKEYAERTGDLPAGVEMVPARETFDVK